MKTYSRNDAAGYLLISATRLKNESFLAAFDFSTAVVLAGTKSVVVVGPEGDERVFFYYLDVERCEAVEKMMDDEEGGVEKPIWVVSIILRSEHGREILLDAGEKGDMCKQLVAFLRKQMIGSEES